MRTVDVIIPVFRDSKRTRDCVESVLTSANENLLHLVVINDASPESELTEWLQERAPSAPFELIEHAENQGFVASANEGMRLHPERDVVLLNSDTVVAGDWLDRLLACAGAESRVGTVTPFSNNATICSFPEPNVANELPTGWTVKRVDALFARINAGRSCEIPTGVGFCLFIRRGCLDDVGVFDEQRFGRGYGEENDFCLRASARGWLHRLCADVFVYHAGGTSFGEEARQLQLRAAAVMEGLHPGYEKLVRDFARLDPAAPLRERVSAELLLQSLVDTATSGSSVLHVLGLGGGGSALHVRQLAATGPTGAAPTHLVLFLGERSIFLQDLRTGVYYPLNGREALTATLATILQALGVATIHWHIVNQTVILLADALTRSGCRQVVTLHDIGFASLSAFSGQEFLQSVSVGDEDWRRRVTGFLQRADAVLAPSHFVVDLCDAVTDGTIAATLVPHPAPPQPEVPLAIDEDEVAQRCRKAGFVAGDPVVALVGALGEHKGAQHWRRMRKAALQHGRGVNWVLIGYADPELRPSIQERCVVHGAYLREELAALLNGYGADLVYFPPGMPESFCYALSDVWLAGWPVVVHDRGALGERLRAHAEGGWILPSALDPQDSLNALQALLEDATGVAQAKRAVRSGADEWMTPPERTGLIMKEIWMTNTQAGPADTGKLMALQGLLRTHLDDSFFRPELIRLSGENQDLRRQATELQEAVKALGELAGEREKWAIKLERDVADLSELAAHRDRWADKLQRDVEALRQASADLFTEKQALLRDKQAVLDQNQALLRDKQAVLAQNQVLLDQNQALLAQNQALISAVESLRRTPCIRASEWLRRQWAKVRK